MAEKGGGSYLRLYLVYILNSCVFELVAFQSAFLVSTTFVSLGDSSQTMGLSAPLFIIAYAHTVLTYKWLNASVTASEASQLMQVLSESLWNGDCRAFVKFSKLF